MKFKFMRIWGIGFQTESNRRPRDWQSLALTNWATLARRNAQTCLKRQLLKRAFSSDGFPTWIPRQLLCLATHSRWHVNFAFGVPAKKYVVVQPIPPSSQNSFWDCYGSFDEQRLFSVKFARFRNFFDFAQILGILEFDKLWEIQCWRVADGKDESW